MVGIDDGEAVGPELVGTSDGLAVGCELVGIDDGDAVGPELVGMLVGFDVGPALGCLVWWLQSPGLDSNKAAASAGLVVKPVLQRAVSAFQPQLNLTPLATMAPSQSTEHRWIRHGSEVGCSVG